MTQKDKESQLDEIERLAYDNLRRDDEFWVDADHFIPGGLYYEMRRREQQLQEEVENLVQSLEVADSDLEVAHQANSEISKHNQELSKDNGRLKEIEVIAQKLNHADQMIIGQANRSQPYDEWQLERNKWMEQLDEVLNPDDKDT